MATSIRMFGGIVSLSKVDFDCPACGKTHPEKFYYNQLLKAKAGYIYKECKACGELLGISYSMRGDVVVWLKEKEATHGHIELKHPVQLVLEWIIHQKQDLEKYFDFVDPLKKLFLITKDGKEATFEFIKAVVAWESSSENKPLETVLKEQFKVEIP